MNNYLLKCFPTLIKKTVFTPGCKLHLTENENISIKHHFSIPQIIL